MISLHIHWVIRVIEEDFRVKISICLSLSEVHIVKVDSNETILHCKMSKVLYKNLYSSFENCMSSLNLNPILQLISISKTNIFPSC
jgi:hypothetical protein